MISSIFYFADTEQEYLDNFNNHQVKPYTIVFCRDTKTLWKNGVRYGGDTTGEVVTSIETKISDAIAAFEQQVNAGTACTTISNRISGNEDLFSEFVSKVTNDFSSATITSKMNSLSGGVVTNANLEYAVAALIARQEPMITLTCVSGVDPEDIEVVNAGAQTAFLPESVENGINAVGDSMSFTKTQFNETFANVNLYVYGLEGGNSRPRRGWAQLQYDSEKHGLQVGEGYYVSDGEYLTSQEGCIIQISVNDLSSEIYSKVDQKIDTATAGLAAKSYVDGKEASILAQVADDISNITITADKVVFNTDFINALTAVAAFDEVIADKIQTTEISANTINAAKNYLLTNQHVIHTNTIIDGNGIRLYNGTSDHTYDSENEDIDSANTLLKNNGSGHLANKHIIWSADGDTYIGPGDPDNDGDGIYVYNEGGSTKIKLQGDIITDNLTFKDKESNTEGYFTNGKGTPSSRQMTTYIGRQGIYAHLQSFSSYPNGSSGNNGDFLVPTDRPALNEPGDNLNGYTVHDWGAIAIGNGVNVPNPKNSEPESHNDMINSRKLSPGTTLVVKGFDGRGYKGFTGTTQAGTSLCFINGICIGPASDIRNSAIFDSDYNIAINGTLLHQGN